jgi:two-component system, cell cycle response regulator
MSNTFTKEINLLYVEDELSVRELLSKRLEKIVKNLYVAQNGQEGYEKYLEFKPDMILTDISMPKLNGIEMTKKIRELDNQIPIIIVSAHSDSSFLLNAIEYGITGYLIKPIDKLKLLNTLERNARNICLNKINIEQQEQIKEQQIILQNIINAEKNISFVTNFNDISFANNSFLEFFDVKSIDEFKIKFEKVEDIFLEYKDYLHKKIIDNYENIDNLTFAKMFFNKLNEIDDNKRIVLMKDKQLCEKSFYLTIALLEEEKKLFLINLTDITKMTMEKNSIEQKAYYDGLTRVFNRNKFDELFDMELSRVKRYKHSLSLAIIDIDHFKKVNDTFGHLVGDEVLIILANNFQSKLRKTDILARWGGEEFVILFIETQLDDAVKCSEMLRKDISELEHKIAGKITVSLGVTEYMQDDTSETLFKRCDDALFRAKENGRNRVEVN